MTTLALRTCLELVSQRCEVAGADQGAGEGEEGHHPGFGALVADLEAAATQQPGHRALDLPALAAQPLRRLDPAAGDPGGDAAAAQRPSAARVVVALVGVE